MVLCSGLKIRKNQMFHLFKIKIFILSVSLVFVISHLALSQPGTIHKEVISNQVLKDSLIQFIGRELTVYLTALKTPENNPETLLGEPFGGDHAKVGLAVTLLDWKDLAQKSQLGPHNLNEWAIALIKSEAPKTSTFGQLFALKALLKLTEGKSLEASNFGQKLSYEDKALWNALGDVRSFYDVKRNQIKNGRPRNYFALALLINAYAHKLGLESAKPYEDETKFIWTALKDTCLSTLVQSGGWMDDDGKNRGRFDRYQFEYHRFLLEAGEVMGDKGLIGKVLPYIKKCHKLWWDQYNPEMGHAAPYGRSLQNAWDDVWEQTATLSAYPNYAPASMPELASAFLISWNYYIDNQYNSQTHLNKMLEFGKGTYSYAGRNRIFSYTAHSFGKALESAKALLLNLEKQKIFCFNNGLTFKPKSSLYIFKETPKKSGVWVVRTKKNLITIPFVSGTSAHITDYLTTVHGLKGFQVPVGIPFSAGVPFLENEMNMVAPTGPCDSLSISKDSSTLTAVWNTLVDGKGQPSEFASCKAKFEVLGETIIIEWNFNFKNPDIIRSWQLNFPTSYPIADFETGKLFAGNWIRENGTEIPSIEVQFESDFGKPLKVLGTENSALSKGHFSGIPLILDWSGGAKAVSPNVKYQIRLLLRP